MKRPVSCNPRARLAGTAALAGFAVLCMSIIGVGDPSQSIIGSFLIPLAHPQGLGGDLRRD